MYTDDAGCPRNIIRIVGGPSATEGRVEICMGNREWGTICWTRWDNRDAYVLCRQLGLVLFTETEASFQRYGMGNGPIYLENVLCQGEESSIFDCLHSNQPSETCLDHTTDVGINCTNGNILLILSLNW